MCTPDELCLELQVLPGRVCSAHKATTYQSQEHHVTLLASYAWPSCRSGGRAPRSHSIMTQRHPSSALPVCRTQQLRHCSLFRHLQIIFWIPFVQPLTNCQLQPLASAGLSFCGERSLADTDDWVRVNPAIPLQTIAARRNLTLSGVSESGHATGRLSRMQKLTRTRTFW
jgi:hypothetical protein